MSHHLDLTQCVSLEMLEHLQQTSQLSLQSELFCEVDGMSGPTVVVNALTYAHYMSLWLSIVFYVASFGYRELYLLFFGLGLTIDGWINYGLRYAFKQPAPIEGCGDQYGMPSFEVQNTTFFITMGISFAIFYRTHMRFFFLVLMTCAPPAVGIAVIQLNYNTPAQVFFGCLTGILTGSLYQFLLYYVVRHWFPRIAQWRWVRAMGWVDSMATGSNLEELQRHLYYLWKKQFPGNKSISAKEAEVFFTDPLSTYE